MCYYFLFVVYLLWLVPCCCDAYSLRNQPPRLGGAGAKSRSPPTSEEEELHDRTDLDSASSSSRRERTRTKLGLLSFDLDDTLFPTTATVRDANEAQVSYMNAHLGPNNSDNHITVEQFLQTTRKIRAGTTSPQTYTALRQNAIRHLYQERLVDDNGLDALTEKTFQIWLQERHRAAERHLFDSTVNSLRHVCRVRFPEACVAAITNGRGDPTAMPALRDYFDFCVSGEDPDVFPHRKPQAGIYQVALRRYRELYPHHHHHLHHDRTNGTISNHDDDGACDNEPPAQEFQYIWCHVGDCLANDVGASADCGAWTIWYAPPPSVDDPTHSQPWSTASTAEWRQRQALAQESQNKVSIRIANLSELEWAIDQLLWRAENCALE